MAPSTNSASGCGCRRARRLAVVALSGLILVVPGCSSSGRNAASCPDRSINAYTLGPNDQIRLVVFRHPDLSGEYEVDGSGYLALPLVDEIHADGRTTRQLEDQIETQLKTAGLLRNPQASVEVLKYRDFYVLGEVNQPLSYPYQSGTTMVRAVAVAGGFTYRANQGGVRIKAADLECRADPTTPVLPGDIVDVPERFF